MKLRDFSPKFFAMSVLITVMFVESTTQAQTETPPDSSTVTPAVKQSIPPVTESSIDPAKEREIIDYIVNGKNSTVALDLTSAQMYFEQAFAKCDEYKIQGPLLARTYMMLGALFVGFLQQIPEGTNFIKMALSLDPTIQPEAEMTNPSVLSTLEVVKQQMGITGPAQVEQQGHVDPGMMETDNFWIMKHERITQAKRMHPLGIHVETNPMVAIMDVKFYFRMPSDRNYQAASMHKNGPLYGMLVGCDAIALLDPRVLFYYIEVIGGDGSIIAREGTLESPIEIKMIPNDDFEGTQPMLPGMETLEECNPDEAAPCPPWDPHCHESPCVTDEDCIGNMVCTVEGFCTEGDTSDDSDSRPFGFSIWTGIGTGLGFVGGKDENGLCGNGTCLAEDGNGIPMATGISSSPMFTRLGFGLMWSFMRIGGWVRLQHIDGMRVAGMGAELPSEQKAVDGNKVHGPMFGFTTSLFFWSNGEWLGPAYVENEHGKLADKQGLRLYTRFEFNVYGAMYHRISLTGKGPDDITTQEYRQRASGLQAVGIGPGLLYGVHKNIDIGAEIMYDYVGLGTNTWAHNFDIALLLHFHF